MIDFIGKSFLWIGGFVLLFLFVIATDVGWFLLRIFMGLFLFLAATTVLGELGISEWGPKFKALSSEGKFLVLGAFFFFGLWLLVQYNESQDIVELQSQKEEEEIQRLLNREKNLQEFYDTYEYSGINQSEAIVVVLGNKNNDILNFKYLEGKNNPKLLGELEVNFKNIIKEFENIYETDERTISNLKFGYSLHFRFGNSYGDDSYAITDIPYVHVDEMFKEDNDKYRIENIKNLLRENNINIEVLGYESVEKLLETGDILQGLFNTKICEMKTKTNESILSTIEPIFFYISKRESTVKRSSDIYLDLDFSKKYIGMDSLIFGKSEPIFFSSYGLNQWNLRHIQLCDFSAITGLYSGSQ